jgi:hypothetical protein
LQDEQDMLQVAGRAGYAPGCRTSRICSRLQDERDMIQVAGRARYAPGSRTVQDEQDNQQDVPIRFIQENRKIGLIAIRSAENFMNTLTDQGST